MFSGATVAVSLIALVVLPQRFLYSLGVAGASVGILSALIALFVVPSILSLAGERINALAIRRGPLGVGRVRRLVPAGPRRHAPAGDRRARERRPAPRRVGAAARSPP